LQYSVTCVLHSFIVTPCTDCPIDVVTNCRVCLLLIKFHKKLLICIS